MVSDEISTKVAKSGLKTKPLRINKPNFVLTFYKSLKNCTRPAVLCKGRVRGSGNPGGG